MSVMRRRRLERLEKLLSKASTPWVDPYDVAMAIWAALEADQAAERAGRPYSVRPSSEREVSPEAEAAFTWAMRTADQMHARLMAEAP
jgi:hypothetical protein